MNIVLWVIADVQHMAWRISCCVAGRLKSRLVGFADPDILGLQAGFEKAAARQAAQVGIASCSRRVIQANLYAPLCRGVCGIE